MTAVYTQLLSKSVSSVQFLLIGSLWITNRNGNINIPTNVKFLFKTSHAALIFNRNFTFMFPFMFVIRKLSNVVIQQANSSFRIITINFIPCLSFNLFTSFCDLSLIFPTMHYCYIDRDMLFIVITGFHYLGNFVFNWYSKNLLELKCIIEKWDTGPQNTYNLSQKIGTLTTPLMQCCNEITFTNMLWYSMELCSQHSKLGGGGGRKSGENTMHTVKHKCPFFFCPR